MTAQVLLFIGGLTALYFGATWLVTGASEIASRFRIPSLVIGLTIVAFGTSFPELVVSVTAAVKGVSDIALGNIIGSNILNISLILGLSAIITPLRIQLRSIIAESPIMVGSAILLLALSTDNTINRIDGALLFSGMIAFTIFIYRFEKRESHRLSVSIKGQSETSSQPEKSINTLVLFILVGLVSLTIGAQFLVGASVSMAQALGLSEKFIGLTIVALGTSLPEFSTSIIAAMRKEVGISVGNIIGSNIFNIFAILGLSSLINPIPINDGLVQSGYIWDFGLMIALSIFLWICMKTGMKITRVEGVVFLIIFIAYIGWLTYLR
jgi:cation:H+ antiporter